MKMFEKVRRMTVHMTLLDTITPGGVSKFGRMQGGMWKEAR
jgi:hypothetical protein